jgi:hypothetical protein
MLTKAVFRRDIREGIPILIDLSFFHRPVGSYSDPIPVSSSAWRAARFGFCAAQLSPASLRQYSLTNPGCQAVKPFLPVPPSFFQIF